MTACTAFGSAVGMVGSAGTGLHNVAAGRVMAAAAADRAVNAGLDSRTGRLGMTEITFCLVGQLTIMVGGFVMV